MSKDLFQKHREEEIYTMVSMPYYVYKQLKCDWCSKDLEEINLIKHYIPSYYEVYKKDLAWSELQEKIKILKEEKKEIEYNIAYGRTTNKDNNNNPKV